MRVSIGRMDPHMQFVVLCVLLLCCVFRDISFGSRCVVVDFERPATVSSTRQGPDGAEIWGYVEVRKGAYLFWSYYKSPHRVSSPEKPWPTVFYAAPAASSGDDDNFNGIGALEPRNSTWLHIADLLVVDTPVGTGYSYEDDAVSGNGVWSKAQTTFPLLRGVFLQAAADILVLLKALTREIASLQNSPLILLHSSTDGGTYAGRIGVVVGLAIRAGALNNLTIASEGRGLVVERFDSRTTPEQQQVKVDTRPRICVSHPPESPIGAAEQHNAATRLWYYVCM